MFSAIFFLNPRLRPILLLDRVAVITVSNSTILFSSQARQCHDGQLCDKRKISLHTINSRSKEDQQHDHLPRATTILTSRSSNNAVSTDLFLYAREPKPTSPTPSPHDRDFDQGVPVSCSVDVCSGITLFYPLWIAPAFLLRGAMLKQGVIQRDKAI